MFGQGFAANRGVTVLSTAANEPALKGHQKVESSHKAADAP